jgi:RNA polymerase sigma-70 factor (ECF subfamily)
MVIATENNIHTFLNKGVKGQEMIYRYFAPKMYGICLRFAHNKMEADDILQEGFIKILTKLNDFRYEGSFEGWIRRTIINTAINYYRRNVRNSRFLEIEEFDAPISENEENIFDKISKEELLRLIQELPNGYRTVFNLNVIEGYTHKEIGEMLNISDNTSKSQLTRARSILQKKVLNLMKSKIKSPCTNLKIVKDEMQTEGKWEVSYSKAVNF